MIISVPKESHRHEHRVGLTPFGAARLVQQGHTVLVEKDAGLTAHFSDRDYEKAGGQIVYSAEEAYKRADLVCRVSVISSHDVDLIRPGSVICGFLHMAVSSRQIAAQLMNLGTTLIGYEIVRNEVGNLPVLYPFSEMAGHMAIHIAAHFLQNEEGGRGVLVGNVTGVPPPTILILGAGTVGRTAARQALACGAHVIILDADLSKLRTLNYEFAGRAVTVTAGMEHLDKYTSIADAVIGAVLIPGARAPFIVTEAMVRDMKPGSVIIDVSIDQGGCIETSRPTTLDSPTFMIHDVVHYCVPNMTANIARTASRALATTAIPYIVALTEKGLGRALREDAGLSAGVYLYNGQMVNEAAGATLGFPAMPLQELLTNDEER
jgi:alanine dehydrogenase